MDNKTSIKLDFVDAAFICNELQISRKSIWRLKKEGILRPFKTSYRLIDMESYSQVKNYFEAYTKRFASKPTVEGCIIVLKNKVGPSGIDKA